MTDSWIGIGIRNEGAAGERSVRQSLSNIEGAADRARQKTGQLGSAWQQLQGLIATFAVVSTIRQIVQISDAYALVEGRLKLVTSSTQELKRTQEELFQIAQHVGVAYEDIARLYSRVAQNAKTLKVEQQSLFEFTKAAAQAFQISGASAQESQGAIIQLTQALASGVFRGEEFNSVAEQGPRILKALEESLGKTRGELRKMAEQGQLTAKLVIDAMLSQSDQIEREFEDIPMTIGRALQQLKNDVNLAVAQTDITPLINAIEALRKLVSDPQIAQGLISLGGGLISFTGALGRAAASSGEFGDLIGYNIALATGQLDTVTILETEIELVERAMALAPGIERKLFAVGELADMSNDQLEEQLKRRKVLLENFSTSSPVAAFGATTILGVEEAVGGVPQRTLEGVELLTAGIEKQLEGVDLLMHGVKQYKVELTSLNKEIEKANQNAAEDIKILQRQIQLMNEGISTEEARTRATLEANGVTDDKIEKYIELTRTLEEMANKGKAAADAIAALDALDPPDPVAAAYDKENAGERAIQQGLSTGVLTLFDAEVQRADNAKQLMADLAKASVDTGKIIAKNLTAPFNLLLDRLAEVKEALTGLGGSGAGAFSRMIGGVEKFIQHQSDLAQATQDVADAQQAMEAAGPDLVEQAKASQMMRDAQQQLSREQEKATAVQLASYAQLTAGAASFFEEGSAGYKAMQNASKVFYAFELAVSLATTAQKLGLITKETLAFITGTAAKDAASTTSTVTQVTNSNIQAEAAAIPSIVTQGAAGPIVGFAMMAAMITFIASLGIKTKGGGAMPSMPTVNPNTGTGGVLGDVEAGSESVSNSISRLVQIGEQHLDVSLSMLSALRDIESTIGNVTANIVQGFSDIPRIGATEQALGGRGTANAIGNVGRGAAAAFSLGLTELAGIGDIIGGFIDTVAGNILRGIFNKKTRQVDTGIAFNAGQTIGDIISDGMIEGAFFAVTRTTTRVAGIKTKTEWNTYFTALDEDIASAIGGTIQNLGGVTLEAVGMLGGDMEAAEDLLNAMTLGISNISLEGLTGEEIQERLTNVISSLGDRMAETVLAVFGDPEAFLKEFQNLGEAPLETLVRVASQTRAFTGLVQDLGLNLVNVGANIETARIADRLIELAGGLEKFGESISNFIKYFYTEEEQLELERVRLGRSFADLGIAMPITAAEFRALVEAQDLSADAGQRMYTALMELAGPMGEFLQNVDNLAEKAAEAAEKVAGADFDAVMNQFASLTDQYVKGIEEVTATLTKNLKAIDASRSNLGEGILSIQRRAPGFSEAGYQGGVIKDLRKQLGSGSIEEQVGVVGKLQDAILAKYEAEREALEANATIAESARQSAQESYDVQLAMAQQLREVYQGLKDFLVSLKLDEQLSILTPEEKLIEARNAYGQTLLKAQANDLDALQNLQGSAQTYLGAVQGFYGSAQPYTDAFNSVQDAVGLIANQSVVDPSAAAIYTGAFDAQMLAVNQQLATLDQMALEELEGLGVLLDGLEVESREKFSKDIAVLDLSYMEGAAMITAAVVESGALNAEAIIAAIKVQMEQDKADAAALIAATTLSGNQAVAAIGAGVTVASNNAVAAIKDRSFQGEGMIHADGVIPRAA